MFRPLLANSEEEPPLASVSSETRDGSWGCEFETAKRQFFWRVFVFVTANSSCDAGSIPKLGIRIRQAPIFFCRINPVVENLSRQAPTFRALRAAIQGDQARRVADLEVLSFNLPITNSLYRVFAGSIKRLLVWAHQAPTLFCKVFAEHYKLLFKVTRQYAGRILRLWVWMRQAQPFYSSFCGRGESSGCDFESAMEKAGWRELTAAHTCYGILNWFRRDWL